MKRHFRWVIGGLVAVFLLGGVSVTSIGSAAEQAGHDKAMHEKNCSKDSNMMGQMADKTEMQKKCQDMMQSQEMQHMMKDKMKSPEMQAMMKQMMQQDHAFHKMMMDLVNSVDVAEQNPDKNTDETPKNDGHEGHHS